MAVTVVLLLPSSKYLLLYMLNVQYIHTVLYLHTHCCSCSCGRWFPRAAAARRRRVVGSRPPWPARAKMKRRSDACRARALLCALLLRHRLPSLSASPSSPPPPLPILTFSTSVSPSPLFGSPSRQHGPAHPPLNTKSSSLSSSPPSPPSFPANSLSLLSAIFVVPLIDRLSRAEHVLSSTPTDPPTTITTAASRLSALGFVVKDSLAAPFYFYRPPTPVSVNRFHRSVTASRKPVELARRSLVCS